MNKILLAAVQSYCDELIAHDPWTWREICKRIIEEIDYDAPATIVTDHITATLVDGRRIEMSRSFDGWLVKWESLEEKDARIKLAEGQHDN
jgi:predicted RNA-binding protein